MKNKYPKESSIVWLGPKVSYVMWFGSQTTSKPPTSNLGVSSNASSPYIPPKEQYVTDGNGNTFAVKQ